MPSEQLSSECREILDYFCGMSASEEFWLNVGEAATALDRTIEQLMPRVHELINKGCLELRTGSRQPGFPWNGLPSVVVTQLGRRIRREYLNERADDTRQTDA